MTNLIVPTVHEDNGNTYWYADGECTIPHREGAPAIIYADGSTEWCRIGKLHRDDGPALETPTLKVWCNVDTARMVLQSSIMGSNRGGYVGLW